MRATFRATVINAGLNSISSRVTHWRILCHQHLQGKCLVSTQPNNTCEIIMDMNDCRVYSQINYYMVWLLTWCLHGLHCMVAYVTKRHEEMFAGRYNYTLSCTDMHACMHRHAHKCGDMQTTTCSRVMDHLITKLLCVCGTTFIYQWQYYTCLSFNIPLVRDVCSHYPLQEQSEDYYNLYS